MLVVEIVFSDKRTSTNLRAVLPLRYQHGYICYSVAGIMMGIHDFQKLQFYASYLEDISPERQIISE